MKAVITCHWPAMNVRHVSRGLAMTDPIDAPSTCKLGNGQTYEFLAHIDATAVKELDPIHWEVVSCVANTPGIQPIYMVSYLPAEGCKIGFNFRDGLHMDVAAIVASTTLSLPDGRTGSGMMVYPACVSKWHSLGLWVVEPVVSTLECEIQ